MKTLIVGGGIAGSALAFALRQGGHDVVVAEARPEEHDAGGAFLYLAPNGVNALRSLGLGDIPRIAGGFETTGMEFRNARGHRIAAIDGAEDDEHYGAYGVVLRRARLHAALADRARAAGTEFCFGARLVDLRTRADGVEAICADGRSFAADVVIGADGLWSTVRQLTWPGGPRPVYNGIVDCGSWTEVNLPDTPRQQMIFGHRAFFGYTVHRGTAYWFTNIPRHDEPDRSELDSLDPDEWMAKLRRLHANDPAPVNTILAAARHSLGVWPLYDMPLLDSWNTDRVCLVGDAAHAVNPATGQGASIAIEDAAVLARRLDRVTLPRAAFEHFSIDRKPRAEKIIQFGRRIGARKASSKTRSRIRDLTLPMFLRMGERANEEHYGYRVDEVISDIELGGRSHGTDA